MMVEDTEAVGGLLVNVHESDSEGVGVLLWVLLRGLMDTVTVEVTEAEVLKEEVELLVSLREGARVSDKLWLGLGGVGVADTELGVGMVLLALQDPESGEPVDVTVSQRVLVEVLVRLAVACDGVVVGVQEDGVALLPVPVCREGDAEGVDRERDQLSVRPDGVKELDSVRERVTSADRVPVTVSEGLQLPDGDGVTVRRLLVCVGDKVSVWLQERWLRVEVTERRMDADNVLEAD